MRRSVVSIVALSAGMAVFPRSARADDAPCWQYMVGLDAGGFAPITRSRPFGASVDARLGLRRGVGLSGAGFFSRVVTGEVGYLFYQPELVLGYRYAVSFHRDEDRMRLLRYTGGFRAGLATRTLELMAVSHVGRASELARSDNPFTLDLGIAADIRKIQWSIGAHSAWTFIHDRGGYLELGAHFEFRWLGR